MAAAGWVLASLYVAPLQPISGAFQYAVPLRGRTPRQARGERGRGTT